MRTARDPARRTPKEPVPVEQPGGPGAGAAARTGLPAAAVRTDLRGEAVPAGAVGSADEGEEVPAEVSVAAVTAGAREAVADA